jgi:tetratricopeptide (TPR) repeat protein
MQNLIDGVIRELGKKNYAEAIKYCNQLIAQFPKNYIFYEIKGNCYLESGNFSEAIQCYNDAIEYFKLTEGKSDSNVATLYNRRGYARLKLKLFEEAIKDFHKATDYKPDFAEAYNNCGNAYRKLEQYEEALKQCNKAVESKPDFAEAYNNRGNIYYLFSRVNEAIFDYTKAIELKSNYTGAYYNRGAAYFYLLNNIIEAKSDWEKVIKLNPSYESELRDKLAKIDEALEQMKKEGEIPSVSEPLSLVDKEDTEEQVTEKTEEHTEEIQEPPAEQPVLEIYDGTKTEEPEETKIEESEETKIDKPEEKEIEKPEEVIEEKTETTPPSEKPEVVSGADIEIPDFDFKSMFSEEDKEIDALDDLKPLSEIFEQIYQPEIKKDDIIPEEVKQLHKEIEKEPEKVEEPPKEIKYTEIIIDEEKKDKPEEIILPVEPGKKDDVPKVTKPYNIPPYFEDEEEKSVFKSPIFIIPLIFLILIAFAVTSYVVYNKFYTKKQQTDKQQTAENIDTVKKSGNIDSTQIRDTIPEKVTRTETTEKEKPKDIKEEKTTTTTEPTTIKNFVVIKDKDGLYLQVASLKDKNLADVKAASINKKKIKAQVVEADLGSKGKYYRVKVGPFKDIEEAKTAANKID